MPTVAVGSIGIVTIAKYSSIRVTSHLEALSGAFFTYSAVGFRPAKASAVLRAVQEYARSISDFDKLLNSVPANAQPLANQSDASGVVGDRLGF